MTTSARPGAGQRDDARIDPPSLVTLAAEGPDVTQAGATNALAMPLRRAFSHHHGAWPDQIRYFEHAIAWSS